MEDNSNDKLQIIVSLEGGLVADVQLFRCQKAAKRFWDASIQEAKRRADYEKLSPAEQKEFDQDPFGFDYGGGKDLVWEEAAVRQQPLNPQPPKRTIRAWVKNLIAEYGTIW
jgi:hypothetical protein